MPSNPNSNIDFITYVKSLANKQGATQPASHIVKNIDLAATVSKLVKAKDRGIFKPSDPDTAPAIINNGVELISRSIMNRIDDNENIFKLFPDIELAAQIVISSILSPKDMVNSELIYGTKTNYLPPQVVSKLIAIVQEVIETEYTLLEDLGEILRKSLFMTGSYVQAILPEAAVDELINQTAFVTTESISHTGLFKNKDLSDIQHLGILGDPRTTHAMRASRKFSVESITDTKMYNAAIYIPPETLQPYLTDEYVNIYAFSKLISENVEVTDNFQFLKMPSVIEKINKQSLAKLTNSHLDNSVMRFAKENLTPSRLSTSSSRQLREDEESSQSLREGTKPKITARELESTLYKSSKTDYRPFVAVPSTINLRRRSTGRPMVMHIPSESAIPVHVPGNPSYHVGYFIPVDIDGNPVTVDSVGQTSGYGLASMYDADRSQTLASLLTQKARCNLNADAYMPMLDHLAEIYADLLEHDMLGRLAKGVYNKELRISRSDEIYRIMLTRTWNNQFTRLVFMPAEYVTYFAFNYHRNGVGKSYLDDLSNITSLRAMVLFSKVMAKVKSSIATTHVHVDIDPRETDPVKTIEMAKHLVARSRQQYFPHGLNRVVDLTDWIQSAGLEITFSGHPRLPTTKFEFETKNTSHPEPDDTLDEQFRHQTYMHFGLSPETVDSAARADFATTIEQNSILFARRITMLSNTFCKDLTDYVQKILRHDSTVHERFTKVFNESKGTITQIMDEEVKQIFESDPAGLTDYLINYFIDVFEITLPKADTTSNTNLSNSFKMYEEMVDQGMKYIFSDAVLPEALAGEASQYVETLKETWKASMMRAWMADNNYIPELFDITDRTQEGKPMADLLEITRTHSENVMLNITSFLESMQAAKAAANKDLEAMGVEGGSDYSSSEESSEEEGMDVFGDEESTPMDEFDALSEEATEGEEGTEETTEPTEEPTEAERNPFEDISDSGAV